MVKKIIISIILFMCSAASLLVATPPLSLAANIDDMPKADAIECLAKNIYFESANESLAGKIAVGMVVLNRVNDSRFPSEICDVVFQGQFGTTQNVTKHPVRNGKCQFSWACDGKPDIARDHKKMDESRRVAELVYQMHKDGYDITDGATHYHASYVSPNWRNDKRMKRMTKVDTHIFYRWES